MSEFIIGFFILVGQFFLMMFFLNRGAKQTSVTTAEDLIKKNEKKVRDEIEKTDLPDLVAKSNEFFGLGSNSDDTKKK